MRSGKKLGRGSLGQSVTEFALVLPIILTLVLGVFELGRLVFIFSAINNASRDTARFAAATGLAGGEVTYLNCDAIRQHARETAFLAGLTDADIQIAYDEPVSGTMSVYAHCGDQGLTAGDVKQGDRIVITITKNIQPILPVLPTDGFSLHFATARSILKNIVVGPVECSDGVDNDGDGFTDYPDDPGCDSADDTTETFCYRLTVSSDPTEAGTLNIVPDPNCANRYIEGSTVHLTASATEQYVFERWSGSVSSTANPVSFVMDGEKKVEAEFRLLEADLNVTKTDSPDPAYAESPLSYEIVVTNPYSDTARDVVITDTLPAGVTLDTDSVTITAGECPTKTNASLICQVPELPVGGNITVNFEVLTPNVNDSSDTITNTVEVSAFEFDPDLTNNTAVATTEVRPRSELTAISKEDSADPVDAATQFNYTITVGNSGPSVATGVVITDTMPAGMSFVSSADACTSVDLSTVRCDVGDLAVGDTDSVTIVVQAPDNRGSESNEVPVTNTATVSGNEFDSDDFGSNTVTETTTIVSQADLTIGKEGPSSATRDVPFDYTLTVTNMGPSAALGVEIVDELQDGLTFYSANSDPSCSADGNIVTCDLDNMDGGTTRIVTISVIPAIDGTVTNSATVGSTTDDPDTFNNDSNNTSGPVETTVSNDVALEITKSDSADPVKEGDSFNYTITVANTGDSTANNVIVEDNLPAGIELDVASFNAPAGWECSATSAGVSCSPDNVDGALLGSLSATFTLPVIATDAGPVMNEATVTATEGEARATEDTTVDPSLNLLLGLTTPPTATAGLPFDYTVTVTNTGPSEATTAVLTNTLSSTGDFSVTVSSVAAGWTCNYDSTNQQVVCDAVEPMAVGTVSFTITVTASDDMTVGAVVSDPASGARDSISDVWIDVR